MIRGPPVKFKEDDKQFEKSELTCCCCFPKGFASMQTEFEKNIYCPNEYAKAIIHVDNTQSSVDATNVTFAVVQHMDIKINGH